MGTRSDFLIYLNSYMQKFNFLANFISLQQVGLSILLTALKHERQVNIEMAYMYFLTYGTSISHNVK